MGGIMRYATEVGYISYMIWYTSRFIKFISGIQKLTEGGAYLDAKVHRHNGEYMILFLFIQNNGRELKVCRIYGSKSRDYEEFCLLLTPLWSQMKITH
jgi:hypothetical protein